MPNTDADITVAPDFPLIEAKSRPRAILDALTRLVVVYPYLITTVTITLVFLLIAYIVSAHIGVPVRDPEGALLGKRMIGPILLMVLFAFFDSFRRAFRMRRAGTREPLLRLTLATFIDRWWWKRLVLAVIGFMSFAFTYLAYRNLKSFVSLINYRSYDQELLGMDRWLSFGHDPATVMHDWLGTGWMAYALSWIYLIYIPLIAIFVSASLAFLERMREAYVYVAAMMWCWILGTLSYYAIPTLGPFASRSRLFDELPYTNVTRLQEGLENTRLELHSDNIGREIVGGIAGFASLHVGVVVAIFFLMRYYKMRAVSWMVFAFLIPTMIATVYFGWHFIIDDIAGVVLGWISVLLGRVTIYPRLMLVWRRRGNMPA